MDRKPPHGGNMERAGEEKPPDGGNTEKAQRRRMRGKGETIMQMWMQRVMVEAGEEEMSERMGPEGAAMYLDKID